MLRNLLRDWWHGFTNEDVASMLRKTEKRGAPGELVWLSDPEFKAWLVWTKRPSAHPVPPAL